MDLAVSPGLNDLQAAVKDYNQVRNCVDKGTLCHAPENSLYFARDGSVLACCYSRDHPIGKYPEQSLDEIWRGARAISMRSALRRNEPPAGCENCCAQIMARNYSGLLARTFDTYALALYPGNDQYQLQSGLKRMYPVRLEFELSNTCNLECAMCDGNFSSTIRMNREKLPPLAQVYGDEFLEQLSPFLDNVESVSFLGGEPFLIDIYYQIWDYLIEKNPNCAISITTNGTVYTSRVKRVLENLNCQVNLSLDSITKGTYEAIRVNGKLERTLANLEEFSRVNRRNNKPLSISVCPMVSNAMEMPKLVSFANERAIKVHFNTVTFPSEQSIRSLPFDQQYELAKFYRVGVPEPQSEVERHNRAALIDVANQIEYWADLAKLAYQEAYEEKQRRDAIPHAGMQWLREVAKHINTALDNLYGQVATRGYERSVETVYRTLVADVRDSLTFDLDVSEQGDLDPIDELPKWYNAIWRLVPYLIIDGGPNGVRFDQLAWDNLRHYLGTYVSEAEAAMLLVDVRKSLLPEGVMATQNPVLEPELDPVSALRDTYRAMWYLGADLHTEGLMNAVQFDPDVLESLLQYFGNSVAAADTERIITAIHKYPLANMNFVGSRSLQDLISATQMFLKGTGLN